MKMQVSVRVRTPLADLRSAEAAFVKGAARLVFEAHPNPSRVLERAANVAEEFDVDIYVDGRLTSPSEIRDKLEEKEDPIAKCVEHVVEWLAECEEEAGKARPLEHPKLQA